VASVAAGRSRYDGLAARNCVNALEGESCDPSAAASFDSICQKVFTGTIADGAACALDTECLPGSLCLGAATSAASCAGVCTHGATLCNDDSHCMNGQVRDHQAASLASGSCVTPVAAGGAGQACGVDRVCNPGLVCSQTATGDTCSARSSAIPANRSASMHQAQGPAWAAMPLAAIS